MGGEDAGEGEGQCLMCISTQACLIRQENNSTLWLCVSGSFSLLSRSVSITNCTATQSAVQRKHTIINIY